MGLMKDLGIRSLYIATGTLTFFGVKGLCEKYANNPAARVELKKKIEKINPITKLRNKKEEEFNKNEIAMMNLIRGGNEVIIQLKKENNELRKTIEELQNKEST